MNNDQALPWADVKTYLRGGASQVNNITDNHSDEKHNHRNHDQFNTGEPIPSYDPSTKSNKKTTRNLETSNRININKPEITQDACI